MPRSSVIAWFLLQTSAHCHFSYFHLNYSSLIQYTPPLFRPLPVPPPLLSSSSTAPQFLIRKEHASQGYQPNTAFPTPQSRIYPLSYSLFFLVATLGHIGYMDYFMIITLTQEDMPCTQRIQNN